MLTAMASLHNHNGPTGSLSNPEAPPWAREVATSLATRPSRASSLISTRTRFSTTTFHEDAKSIDLSISGQHFRISRDGSTVTSINNGESLPPYPFSPLQESSQHDRSYHRHVGSDPGSTNNPRDEPIEDTIESQVRLPAQSNLASSTANADPANPSPSEADASFPVIPSEPPEHAGTSDHCVSNSFSGLAGSSDKTNTLTSMAVRIQRAWRNYAQYHSPSSKLDEPTSSPIRTADQSPAVAQTGLPPFTISKFLQRAPTNPQLRRGEASPVSVPVPKKSISVHDKDLPIPDEAADVPGRDSGLPFPNSISRRPGTRDVDRGGLVATAPRSQNLGLAMFDSTKVRSTNQRYKPVFTAADGRESAEQLSPRKWFTGEDSKRFRDTDEPGPPPIVSHLPKAMDSENDVSNHYTSMIRFIDRDYRRALHARDKEMAELRERLNEKDIVYRQELRARDFLIEDLKKRLDHLEETTETEIERAQNQVEDLWESRWKDRDFHLRERMQRMESEMQKTMETTIAEREAFWRSKCEELRRRLDIPEGLSDN
jgi:hypothetical protein